MQKSKKERMKNAGQGLLATGAALGAGGIWTRETWLIIPMAIFLFFGAMLYTASRLEETEED